MFIIMTKKDPAHSVEILWQLYSQCDSITTKDVGNILWISDQHASNILRSMWGKKWLSRKIEYTKPHGRRYRYFITDKGVELIEWLESKGVVELPRRIKLSDIRKNSF